MNDELLKLALAPARALEPTDAEIAVALRRSRPRRRYGLAVGLSALVLATGTAYAVTPIRGALGSLANWVAGNDEAAPGRAVAPSDNAPAWLGTTSTRVIAQAGTAKLYVKRERPGVLSIGVGDSVGISGKVDELAKMFANRQVQVLGPGDFRVNQPFDDRWRRPLFGLTSKTVARVKLTYASGPPLADDDVHGGFVLLADALRPLQSLIAYDAAGRVVERQDVSGIELRVCREARGCPPGRLEPRRR